MSENNTQAVTAVTSYDLISLNSYAIPDVKKGQLTITPIPKYNEYENEIGGKVIDIIAEGMISGTVSYNGLMESELQAIMSHLSLVSTMVIYNPLTNTTKTFKALILVGDSTKIIHDANANAWSFSFSFEEIGAVVT